MPTNVPRRGRAPGKRAPAYHEQVWELVRLCPPGRVTTYGALADALTLGTPRMAGYAMRASFGAEPPVPAHRVVNSKGVLSGRNAFPTPTAMAEALAREGVTVLDGERVADFAERFWDPATA